MVCPDHVIPLAEPQEILGPEILKTLGEFKEMLAKISRQVATIIHDPGTADKVVIIELSAMITGTGFDGADALLESIQLCIRAVLVEIKRAKDVKLAIDTTIALFSRDNRKNLLLVHRTTAELAEPRLTRRQVDELLAENYKACMADLTSMGARSPSVILANRPRRYHKI